MLAARHHTENVPDVICTLFYIVAVVASIIAVVLLLLSLIGSTGPDRTVRFGGNWLYAAAVAVIAWLLLLFFC